MFALRVLGGAITMAKANVTSLSTPLKINLCVTYACQYRCQTCNIWQRTPTNELTTDELLSFVEKNRDATWLDVTGGEIFLRKDIGEILEAIVTSWRRLAVLHFPTNGFLTQNIVTTAERLARAASVMTVITVSLDGDEHANDTIRGIKGGFVRQLETFKALRGIAGIHAVLGMTLSRFNAGTFQQTFEACRRHLPDLRREEFHLNIAQTSAHYYGNAETALRPPRDAIAQDLATYRPRAAAHPTAARVLERVYLSQMDKFLDTGRTPMPCHALRSSCFIDPHGVVFPCISYSRPLGSLRDTAMALEPIWNRAQTRDVQRAIWQGDCPQCWTACEAYQSILGNVVRPHVFWRHQEYRHGS
jgi:radical SAM protein with 4Fe4S-binding SPASM domain